MAAGDILYFEIIKDKNGKEAKVPVFNTGHYKYIPSHEEAKEIIEYLENLKNFTSERIEQINRQLYAQSDLDAERRQAEQWNRERSEKEEKARQRRAEAYFDYDPAKEKEILDLAARLSDIKTIERYDIEAIERDDWNPSFESECFAVLLLKDDVPVTCMRSTRKLLIKNILDYKKKYDVNSVAFVPVREELQKDVVLETKIRLELRIKSIPENMVYATSNQIVLAYSKIHGLNVKPDKLGVMPVAFSGISKPDTEIYRKRDIAEALGFDGQFAGDDNEL